MHKLNVLILGPINFVSTINELKTYLKFNFYSQNDLNEEISEKLNIVLFHCECLKEPEIRKIIDTHNCIKIIALDKKQRVAERLYEGFLSLPTTVSDFNSLIEKSMIKKEFSDNSSIKVKKYILDKNEKKLFKIDKFIILTEKEVQLIEIFLNNKKPISKDQILKFVWNYSSNADTHTVETHIYRLRKKINDKFSDNDFILNDKKGYYI